MCTLIAFSICTVLKSLWIPQSPSCVHDMFTDYGFDGHHRQGARICVDFTAHQQDVLKNECLLLIYVCALTALKPWHLWALRMPREILISKQDCLSSRWWAGYLYPRTILLHIFSLKWAIVKVAEFVQRFHKEDAWKVLCVWLPQKSICLISDCI